MTKSETSDFSDYRGRLAVMEGWYKALVERDDREELLLQDYQPHREFLSSARGRVLDVGGGAGLAARFLSPAVEYVVVDPSEVWDSAGWRDFGRQFRRGGPEPRFIDGVGEALPFDDATFDVALSFWSLNHAADPEACIAEIARVLRKGGRALIVLEDVEPRWRDLWREGVRRLAHRLTGRRSAASISGKMRDLCLLKLARGWPVQEDHVVIAERDLDRWSAATLRLQSRQWLGGFLTLQAMKR